jgi:hypothetical protein
MSLFTFRDPELTLANQVIDLSRWCHPPVEDPCSDRVYRIGQTEPVHIYCPLAVLAEAEEFSFDVQLQMLMDRKRQPARSLLTAPSFTKDVCDSLLAGTPWGVVLADLLQQAADAVRRPITVLPTSFRLRPGSAQELLGRVVLAR